MTAEFVTPSDSAHFTLPGKPVPYFLEAGDGERSHLFDQLFTVLLSGDETDGQFGVFTMEAPRGDAIPVHSHAGVHEIFFVLDGRIRVVVEDGAGRTAAGRTATGSGSTACSARATSATSRPVGCTRSASSRTGRRRSA